VRITILDTGDPGSVSGGQSAFIRNVIPWLDGDVRVMGVASEAGHLRKWHTRTLGQSSYSFLPLAHNAGVSRKPVVPVRLRATIGILRLGSKVFEDADVLYVHSQEMLLPLMLRRARTPIVFHMHGATNPLRLSRYRWARLAPAVWSYERLCRIAIQRCDVVISVDSDGMRRCEQAPGNPTKGRCFLVPTCFDERIFRLSPEMRCQSAFGVSDGRKQIVFVGRLEEGKGTDLLLSSFALLAERRDDVGLVVVGDGTQRAKMEVSARTLGVSDRVQFEGWAEPEKVARLLQASDLYFLPSLAEGLPIAVLEALACGTPVVATPVGDLARVIEDGVNGFLVPFPSPDCFRDVLERALDHPWGRATISDSVASMTSGCVASQVSALLCVAANGRR
jgi:glycosyltransferase involved in cell wall biosynthesis